MITVATARPVLRRGRHEAGSGSGEGRTRLTREGRKLDRRQVRNGDPTADKSGGSRPIERRTFRSDPDAGSKGEARKGSAGANRGDAERLLKTRYESFGVPRPSTLKGDRHTHPTEVTPRGR